MAKQETIQVLQTIEDRAVDFPYMTACDWVAIAAAKRHLQEEPVSGSINFEQELYKAFGQIKDFTLGIAIAKRFYNMGSKAGAKWQFGQLEKNRLAHCDAQKDEEAEIERDFVMGVIENEHRQPTFDDAIKYGMRLQKERMMANAVETTFNVSLSSGLYDKLWIKGCKEGDKLLVIKKDEL